MAPQVTGYLGNNQDFAEAVVRYANNYADVVEKDYEVFRTACRNGTLKAQSDEDFRADLSSDGTNHIFVHIQIYCI